MSVNQQSSFLSATLHGTNGRRVVDETSRGNRSRIVKGEAVVAKILGGGALEGYLVECYPAFPDETTGKFNAVLSIVEISLGTVIPVNTYTIAHLSASKLIGGGA